MSADHSTKQPSSDSLMHLVVQVLSDRMNSMDARLLTIERVMMTRSGGSRSSEETAASTGTPMESGFLTKLTKAGNVIVLAWKMWEIWRKISWPVSIGFYAWFAAKFLGWL